jgi:hypothetical protein
MAKTFTTWTVLPHDPIEKLADNLWRVSGTLNQGKLQRQMVLARLADGRVVIHNAIALREEDMKQIEAWGTPSVLFVPNAFHRQDAAIWKQRYPGLTVVTPAGARKRVAQVVPVDAITEEAPSDESVRLAPVEGVPGEGVLEVRSAGETSLVFCDAVLNMPRRTGLMGFALAPTGQVSVPRVMRWIGVKDKRAFAGHLERLAGTGGLRRVLFGHGDSITDDAPAALRRVVTQLRS